ncbi:MAG: hypothetical protein GX640_12420 [Fibrobacter sp.]|nr:hypothetical protein [Fibrobacter sp.]
MSSEHNNYVFLRKKSYFWYPLAMMGIVFYKAYGELLEYSHIYYVSFIIWLFIGVNSVLLVCSYLIMKRGVHKACDLLMAAFSMFFIISSGFDFSEFKDFWYLYLNALAGLILFLFSFFNYSDEFDLGLHHYSDESE